jgi:hypothetical protein
VWSNSNGETRWIAGSGQVQHRYLPGGLWGLELGLDSHAEHRREEDGFVQVLRGSGQPAREGRIQDDQ